MINPLASFPITGTWAEHIARGSSGGIDWGVPVGTPIRASESGNVSYIYDNGTLGHTVTLIRDPNHTTQFGHLSRFEGGARYVNEGDIIGYSGGAVGSPGAGSSTGPHVHSHSYEFGTRVPPFFLGAAAGIGGSSNPARKKAPEMIGYNYNVPGGAFGSKVLADPVSMTYRYPIADELSAFEQSGGVWVSLDDGMWNNILGRYREIKRPDAVGGGTSVGADPAAIAAALAANPDFTKAIAASVKVPSAAENGAAARAAIVKP